MRKNILVLFVLPMLFILFSCKNDCFKLKESENDMYVYKLDNLSERVKLSDDDKESIINEINKLDYTYIETEIIYGNTYSISYNDYYIIFQDEYINVTYNQTDEYYITKKNTDNIYNILDKYYN